MTQDKAIIPTLVVLCKPICHSGNVRHFVPRALICRHIDMLVLPGQMIGDMDGVGTEGYYRQNVRTQRITNHHKFTGIDVVAAQNIGIGGAGFFADDFDVPEVIG